MAATETDATNAGAENELEQSLDPRAISVWRWSAGLVLAPIVVAFSLLVLVVTAGPAPAPAAGALWTVWALLVGAAIAYLWKYPPARHRHLRYRLDDVGLTIRAGVLWRTWSALPRVRIQHTDVSQGPLQRRYGVADLKLYTAGSRYTRIVLSGLEHGAALALRDELKRDASDDAV